MLHFSLRLPMLIQTGFLIATLSLSAGFTHAQDATPAPAEAASAAALYRAIELRDPALVSPLVQANPGLLKVSDQDGYLPLQEALRNDYGKSNEEAVVTLLLNQKADVNAVDRNGATPLRIAIEREASLDLMRRLIASGADLKGSGTDGRTPLHVAVQSAAPEIIALLLADGVDPNIRSAAGDTPLHLAVAAANPSIVTTLLNAGANVNLRNKQGDMPLHVAMRLAGLPFPLPAHLAGNPPDPGRAPRGFLIESLLIGKGAQINARDQSGMTPLLYALVNRDKPDQAALIQHHAALDNLTAVFNAAATDDTGTLARLIKSLPDFKTLRAPNGATALHVAALWNAPNTTRLLLRSGLDINARDSAAESPLHYACWFPENTALAGLLLDQGANINAGDNYQETPLHRAASSNSDATVRLLLSRKADIAARNLTGETALQVARVDEAAGTEVPRLLLEAGAAPDPVDKSSRSLLSQAIGRRNPALVALLVSQGADVNRPSAPNGFSPLMQAAQSGSVEIVQILLAKGADIGYKTRSGRTVLSTVGSSTIRALLKQRGAN